MKPILFILTILTICLNAFGQSFVYNFVNPSFIGGNIYNGNYLLANAQSQSNFNEGRESALSNRNLLDDFSSSLKRSLLNQLSKELLADTFGEGYMEEGTYEFGTFTVEITNNNDGINIRLYDVSTGNETEILIPYF